MDKMPGILDTFKIAPKSGSTITQQIRKQVAWLIASGQLSPGDPLPSVREFANHLSVNLHTIRSAYKKLELDGLVETRHGLGTRILSNQPARLARAEGSTHTNTIGVILPSLENPFYHAFLQGIEELTHRGQAMLFVCNAHEDGEEARRYFAQLSAKRVDGIIVATFDIGPSLPPKQEEYEPTHLPVVTVDWPNSAGYSVLINLEEAGYLATKHLIEHGHRRVGLITYHQDAANVRPVNAGYERALLEAAIQPEPSLVSAVEGFGMEDGAEGARNLLSSARPPTAIFAIADVLALGAMDTIKKAGLKIPQDIALTGFNDIPIAGIVDPPLTTVASPTRQMGLEAMKMLQSLIAGKKPARRKVILPVMLKIRESCGCHP